MIWEVLAASLILSLFGLAMPLFTQMIVDRVLVSRSASLLNMLLGGMLIVIVFRALMTAIRRLLLIHISVHTDARLISDFMRHVFSLPMRFFDLRRVGDIVSRVSENEKIRSAMVGTIPGALLDVVLAVVYIAIMLSYSAPLTLIVLVVVALLVILVLSFTPAIRRNRKEHFSKHAAAWSYLIESVTGMGTVKSVSAEHKVRWQMESLFVDSLLTGRQGAQITIAYSSLATFLQTIGSTLFLWYGAHLVMDNAMSIGQMLAFIALAANVMGPALRLVDVWETLQDVRNAIDRLNDVFDARPEERGDRALLSLKSIDGRITFDEVEFRYSRSQDKPTLSGVSLDILPGQTVAVVGRSGSGKSTLGKLVLGLYAPAKGRVLIDGHDIRTLAPRSLRRRVGVVPQDVFLFSGTIRENIALSSPDAPFEQIVRASKMAGAHEFISGMGMGYDTKVGERGMSVSGGQRQRIALARALLCDPDILLLDEATSALDNESERLIQQNLDEATKDRTTIVIAHRLSTVRNADRIVVLDDGNIVEEGTHEELLERGGIYSVLVGEQIQG
jgi:ATP-binding cassette subfamily B protein